METIEEIVFIILDVIFWANITKMVNVCKPNMEVLQSEKTQLFHGYTQPMLEEIKKGKDVD